MFDLCPLPLAGDFKPIARLDLVDRRSPRQYLDDLALARATRESARRHRNRCSGVTGTWSECLWSNAADFSAMASSAAETSLLSGVNDQPVLPALFFHNKTGRYRAVTMLAKGVFGTTSTPTIIFQLRLGITLGASFLSGTSIGVSAAITTQSGVSNKYWELAYTLICNSPGLGAGNTTLSGAGQVTSPGGFASPFIYPLEPTTPDTATWTSTIDNSVTQYLNLSATWSSSSPSNTITCKQLLMFGWN